MEGSDEKEWINNPSGNSSEETGFVGEKLSHDSNRLFLATVTPTGIVAVNNDRWLVGRITLKKSTENSCPLMNKIERRIKNLLDIIESLKTFRLSFKLKQ